MNVWPPYPPEPLPRRTPWQPQPAPPPTSTPNAPSWTLHVATRPDWLTERLIERRLMALAGELDRDATNQTVAELALLDASGDEPVTLHLTGVSADLDTALTVVDALDLMGVEVHATCLGTITGAAVAILAVADRRTAGPHATVHLREPRLPHHIAGRDLDTYAKHYERQLRRLQNRIAQACHRPVDAVAADMRAHRVLTAEQAGEYGLIDSFGSQSSRAGSGVDATAIPPTTPPDPAM
jgi:ATP-dependent Clp protease, protease subunit